MIVTVKGQRAYAYTGSRNFDAAIPSVVFIHGAANDHSVWQLQSRYFAHHGFNALAIDLPGHGRSGGEACASVGDYVDWVAGFLDAAGIAQASLAGHSMGSLIASETALRHRGKVERLALLGTSIPMPVADVLLDAAKNDPPAAFDMLNLWSHAPASKLGKSPSPGLALLGNGRRLLEQSRPGALHNDLSACKAYASDAPRDALRLAAISCPTLVIAGTRDQMTPAKAGMAVAAMIPGAKLVTVDAGHAMMGEAPDAVLAALRDFFAHPPG